MSEDSKPYTLVFSDSMTNISKFPKSRSHCYRSFSSRLRLVRNKLLHVINKILKAASENNCKRPEQHEKTYYLTVDQYRDVMWAAQILKEVNGILKMNKAKKAFHKLYNKPQNFNVNAKMNVNKGGKMYIDTLMLDQLIYLHNLLRDITDFVQEMPLGAQGFPNEDNKENGSSQPTTFSSNSCNGDKYVNAEEMNKKLTLPLSRNFVIMTANNLVSKDNDLPEGKAIISNNPLGSKPKSFAESKRFTNKKSEVVNAANARKMIVKCMAHLDNVRQFLEQNISVHIEKTKSDHGEQEQISTKKCTGDTGNCIHNLQSTCVCPRRYAGNDQSLEFTWKENREAGSKLVVCIKSKTECDDNNVNEAIRLCSECHNLKRNYESEIIHREESNEELENSSVDGDMHHVEKKTKSYPSQQAAVKYPSEPTHSRETSNISHHRHSENCAHFVHNPQYSHQNIKVIFNSENPSHSVVEGPNIKRHDTVNLSLRGVEAVERAIPIFRTKICSSMEIDVELLKSKLRTTGLQHPDAEVQKILNDFGINNILRASRPAKCGRMAVLDEFSKKSLPYAPSLRSLPLDDVDIQFVNQSLNMSMNKIKNCRIMIGVPA